MLLPGGVTKGTGPGRGAGDPGAVATQPGRHRRRGERSRVPVDLRVRGRRGRRRARAARARRLRDARQRRPSVRWSSSSITCSTIWSTSSPRLARHHLQLGEGAGGAPVAIPAHGTSLLIVGPSAQRARRTLTGVLVERLVETGRSLSACSIPKATIGRWPSWRASSCWAARASRRCPRPTSSTSSCGTRARASCSTSARALAREGRLRDQGAGASWPPCAARTACRTGSSIDEAHHIFPAEGSPAADLLARRRGARCLITLDAAELAPHVAAAAPTWSRPRSWRRLPARRLRHVLGRAGPRRRAAAPGRARRSSAARRRWRGSSPSRPPSASASRRRRVEHRRHLRKYTEGELPPERSLLLPRPAASAQAARRQPRALLRARRGRRRGHLGAPPAPRRVLGLDARHDQGPGAGRRDRADRARRPPGRLARAGARAVAALRSVARRLASPLLRRSKAARRSRSRCLPQVRIARAKPALESAT